MSPLDQLREKWFELSNRIRHMEKGGVDPWGASAFSLLWEAMELKSQVDALQKEGT